MHLNPRSVFLAYLTFLRISLKFAIAITHTSRYIYGYIKVEWSKLEENEDT